MNKLLKSIPIVLLIIGVLVAMTLIMGDGRFYDPHFGAMRGGMMTMGFIGMLLFWGLVIFLIVSVFKESPSTYRVHSHNPTESERPETILERRFARGEISREEYREMRTTLKGGE